MSTDLTPDDDRDLSSTIDGQLPRITFILFGVIVATSCFVYFYWIHPAMNGTTDTPAEKQSAQNEMDNMPADTRSSEADAANALRVFKEKTVDRHEQARRELEEVDEYAKQVTDIAVDTNTLILQDSDEIGQRLASKVFQKADLIPIKNLAESLSKEIPSLREDLDVWTKMREELIDGDRGKPIAVDQNLVDRFANIEMPAVTPLDIRNWTDILPLLLEQMQGALARDAPSLAPLEAYTARIDALAEKIREASESIRQARLAVAVIEREAQSTRVTADTPTLRKALDNREIRLKDELQMKREEQIQKTREDLAKKLADQATKDEAAAVAMKIEARRAAEKATLEAKRKRAALEARFQSALPEIRSYLRPYLAHGTTQPNGQNGKRGPVSLSALRGLGALNAGAPDEYDQSLQTLVTVTTSNNDRPASGFPTNVLPRRDLPYLRKVQSLLIEFGPLMVEKDMLAE